MPTGFRRFIVVQDGKTLKINVEVDLEGLHKFRECIESYLSLLTLLDEPLHPDTESA